MHELTNTYVFGILLCLAAFVLAMKIRRKTGSVYFNPFILSIVFIIAFLSILKIPYEHFQKGAASISVFLGPVTVLLAVPLYRHRNLLNLNKWAIFMGITVGSIVSLAEVHYLSDIFGLGDILEKSLMSKSVTAPIAIEITNGIGGISGLTVFGTILSGILGSFLAPFLYKLFKIDNPIAQGIGLGSASHAIGTSKALEMGGLQGAVSGLAIGIMGIVTVLIMSVLKIFLYT